MANKKASPPNVSKFATTLDVFFCFQDHLLIVGEAEVYVPTHADRLKLARDEKKLTSDKVYAAEFFYGNVEKSLKSANLRVYELPEGFIDDGVELQKYRDDANLSTLEKLIHITDYNDIQYYEFSSHFYNECMHLFGRGIRLGKKRGKNLQNLPSVPSKTLPSSPPST